MSLARNYLERPFLFYLGMEIKMWAKFMVSLDKPEQTQIQLVHYRVGSATDIYGGLITA